MWEELAKFISSVSWPQLILPVIFVMIFARMVYKLCYSPNKHMASPQVESNKVKNRTRRNKIRIIVYLLILFFLGSFFYVLQVGPVQRITNEWRANHNEFQVTTCYTMSEYIQKRGRMAAHRIVDYYVPYIHVRYVIDSFSLDTWVSPRLNEDIYGPSLQVASKEFYKYGVGKYYPCWYDPNDYSLVVLERGYFYTHQALTVLSIFIIVWMFPVMIYLYIRIKSKKVGQ